MEKIMAKIIVHMETGSGLEYEIHEKVILGRQTSNEIPISDKTVSRQHARIWSDGEEYCVEDLKSLRGTLLNGKRITTKEVLQHGDVLQMGKTIVTFVHKKSLPSAELISEEIPLSTNGNIIAEDITAKSIPVLQEIPLSTNGNIIAEDITAKSIPVWQKEKLVSNTVHSQSFHPSDVQIKGKKRILISAHRYKKGILQSEMSENIALKCLIIASMSVICVVLSRYFTMWILRE